MAIWKYLKILKSGSLLGWIHLLRNMVVVLDYLFGDVLHGVQELFLMVLGLGERAWSIGVLVVHLIIPSIVFWVGHVNSLAIRSKVMCFGTCLISPSTYSAIVELLSASLGHRQVLVGQLQGPLAWKAHFVLLLHLINLALLLLHDFGQLQLVGHFLLTSNTSPTRCFARVVYHFLLPTGLI